MPHCIPLLLLLLLLLISVLTTMNTVSDIKHIRFFLQKVTRHWTTRSSQKIPNVCQEQCCHLANTTDLRHLLQVSIKKFLDPDQNVSSRWLASATVKTSRGDGFNSRSGRYQVVTVWMDNCLQTDKPSWYITNTQVNSAFHPSEVGKSTTSLPG